MSLLKVVLLLSSAIGLHVTITPPHVANRQELAKPSFREIYFSYVAASIWPVKSSVWLLTLAQIVAILLPLLPPSKLPPIAHTIIHALGGPDTRSITPPFFIGASLATLGGLLRWACYRALGPLFTFHLSVRKDHRLVTTGPYSVVRHPSYTAAIICMLSIIVMHGYPGSWLRYSGVSDNLLVKSTVVICAFLMVTAVVVALRRCPAEDEMMRREFGKEWEEWAARVKYWLVPGIY